MPQAKLQQISPRQGRGQFGCIAARGNLLDGNRARLLLRVHDLQRPFRAVEEVALRIDRFQGDARPAVFLLDAEDEVAGLVLARGVADQADPEAAEIGPPEPGGRPAALGVGGKGHADAQPVPPPDQQRVAGLGGEDQLAGRFGLRLDVAQQRGDVSKVQPGQHGRRSGHLGEKRLFADPHLARAGRIQREDLRHRGRIVAVVVAPVTDAGEVLQERAGRLLAHRHGRKRDPRAGDLPGKRLEVAGVRDAVGQENDVLQVAKRLVQRQVRPLQRREGVRPAAGRDRADPLQHRGLVGAGVDGADPGGHLVEGDHADLVLRIEQLDRPPRGLLGQLDGRPFHRRRAVDHQDHRQAGPLALSAGLAADREDFLQRGAAVAAGRERLVAADGHEPAAEVAHVVPHPRHLPGRERGGRDVGKHQQVVLLEFGRRAGEALRRADLDVDPLALKGRSQGLRKRRPALDQQHPGPGRRQHQPRGRVVLGDRVLEVGDLGGVADGPQARDRLGEKNAVGARGDLHLLLVHAPRAAKQLDGALAGAAGVDHRFHEERLALLHLPLAADRRDVDLRIAARRKRHDPDGHTHGPGRCHGVPLGLAAVGKQDQARQAILRHGRAGRLDHRRQIGRLAVGLRQAASRPVGELARCGRKRQHRDPIAAGVRHGLVDELRRRFARGLRHARALVHGKQDELPPGGSDRPGTAQGQHHGRHHERPAQKRHRTPKPGVARQAPPAVVY